MNSTAIQSLATEYSGNDDAVAGHNPDDLRKKAYVVKNSIDSLNTEQNQVHGVTALNWLHWIILCGSLIATISAWYFSSNTIAADVQNRFDQQNTQIVALLGERLEKYEDALWSGVAASQTVNRLFTRSEWKSYAATLDIRSRHPGISGIGLIVPKQRSEVAGYVRDIRRVVPEFHVHPPHAGEESFIITQIEPVVANREAVGLDVAFEKNRRDGANLSRDTGDAIITGPIVLVQDKKKTPGFLFYAPVYKATNLTSAEMRRNAFSHWVYAPFIMSELIQGVLERESREFGIRITDNGEELYSEWSSRDELDIVELGGKQSVLDIYGRQWLVEAWPLDSFYSQTESNQPFVILICGLLIDAMLLLLFLSMSRSNRRIIALADDLATANDHLNEKSIELQQSNIELQSFACVASHDLKSPLSSIRYMVDFVEEEIANTLDENTVSSEVQQYLAKIRNQSVRMSRLIDGILDYSAIGKSSSEIERVELAELLAEIQDDLQLSCEQLAYDSKLPFLNTLQLPLKQVLANLIGNAVKYHPDPKKAVARVAVEEFPNYHRFSISDTGPGIDPKNHERIFEVFETLNRDKNIDSTGVGLAIVKKTVVTQGGTITVESALGEGATFTFTWPKKTPE